MTRQTEMVIVVSYLSMQDTQQSKADSSIYRASNQKLFKNAYFCLGLNISLTNECDCVFSPCDICYTTWYDVRHKTYRSGQMKKGEKGWIKDTEPT